VRYQLEPTPEVVKWLLDDSHPQADVRERVQRKFNQAFRYVRESGPYVGKPHLRKLRGYDVYEIRIEDETGWYRIFCRFGQARGGFPIKVALAYSIRKLERSASATEYRRAEQAVAEWLEKIDK
jgi:hypothetical protein